MSTTKATKAEVILLLGGTFDPIHLGHTLPAQETALWLGSEQVSLILAHIPPHKSTPRATAEQRVAMTNLVCRTNSLFRVDTRELQRNSYSFTVDTLLELKAEQPAARLHFIMGMDSLLSFTRWERWQKILTLCHVVVNIRPGYSHQKLEDTIDSKLLPHIVYSLAELEKHTSGKIIIHDSTACNISSTQIRDKIKDGDGYAQFLNQDVHKYIEQQQLYR